MVNVLEALYALTAISVVGLIVAALRRSRRWIQIFGVSAFLGAVASSFLYWRLSPPA